MVQTLKTTKVKNNGRIIGDGNYEAQSLTGVQSVVLQSGAGTGVDGLDVTLSHFDRIEGSLRDDTVTLLTVADARHGAVSLGRGYDTLVLDGGEEPHTLKLDSVEMVQAAAGDAGDVTLKINGVGTFATDGSVNLNTANANDKSKQTITYTEMVDDTTLSLGGGQDKVIFKAGTLFRVDNGQLVATDGNGSVKFVGYASNATNLQIQVGNVTQTYKQWYKTADITPPVPSNFTATETTVGATSDEAGMLGLYYKNNMNNLIGAFSAPMTAGTPATINVLAQASVTEAILRVSDRAGNFATATQSVVLGTSGVDANLVGTIQNDVMFGFDCNDIITGGLGADVLYGGADNDTYMYATSADFVTGTAVVDSIYDASGTADKAVIAGAISIVNTQSLARAEGVEQLLAAAVNDDDNGATGALAHSIVINSDTTINDVRTIDLSASADAQSTGVINLTGVTVAVTGTTLKGVIAGQNTITGGAGVDSITGGNVADTITGGAGADNIDAGAGNDTVIFNTGDVAVGEVIDGGDNGDLILVQTSTDFTNLGAKRIKTDAHFERIEITNDQAATFTGAQLSGELLYVQASGAGAATLTINVASGTTADLSKLIFGLGTYTVNLNGADGAETIIGTSQADAINGGGGDDVITGGQGADSMDGGAGNNTFVFNNDVVAGEQVTFSGTKDTFRVESSTSFQNLNGGSALTGLDAIELNNSIAAFNADQLTGLTLSVTDTAVGAVGRLRVEGKSGDSAIDLSNITLDENSETWIYDNVGGDDIIKGTTGKDFIYGGLGNDVITGGAGADVLTGGAGADVLTGGAGADVFSLTGVNAAENGDTVADFAVAEDKVGLDVDLTDAATSEENVQAAFATHSVTPLTVASNYFLGNQTGKHIVELTNLNENNGNLSIATDGTELFKLLANGVNGAVNSLVFDGDVAFSRIYLLAYDAGNAYLYLVENDNDKWAAASAVKLVGTFDNSTDISSGAFEAANFVMVA